MKPKLKSKKIKVVADKTLGRKIKDQIQLGSQSSGNSVETMGNRLQKNGYRKLGVRVKNVGDLFENMGKPAITKSSKGRAL